MLLEQQQHNGDDDDDGTHSHTHTQRLFIILFFSCLVGVEKYYILFVPPGRLVS